MIIQKLFSHKENTRYAIIYEYFHFTSIDFNDK